MMTVTTEVRVRYAETDQMGVVYYANYLVWFEIGRVELLRALGFSYRQLESEHGCICQLGGVVCGIIELQLPGVESSGRGSSVAGGRTRDGQRASVNDRRAGPGLRTRDDQRACVNGRRAAVCVRSVQGRGASARLGEGRSASGEGRRTEVRALSHRDGLPQQDREGPRSAGGAGDVGPDRSGADYLLSAVEREIQSGDYVLLDLKSEKEALTRPGYATVVRPEDRETEFPFSGFARELLGLKAGDSQTIHHDFTQDFSEDTLAGQSADIEATIKTVGETGNRNLRSGRITAVRYADGPERIIENLKCVESV